MEKLCIPIHFSRLMNSSYKSIKRKKSVSNTFIAVYLYTFEKEKEGKKKCIEVFLLGLAVQKLF